MSKPFKIIDLGFSRIELFPNYLVNHCREGVVIDYDEINSLIMLFDRYYPNKKFGYISNRIESYTVNPIMHQITTVHPNLKAYAIVCYSKQSAQNVSYEQKFSKLKFHMFHDLQTAKNSMEDYVTI